MLRAYVVSSRDELKPGAHVTIIRALKKPDGTYEADRVTVGRDVWEQARALPWAESASEVVNEALHRLVAAGRLGVMLDRLAEDFGPVDEDLVTRAEATWFGE